MRRDRADEDMAYDAWVQRLLDARADGRAAGLQGLSIEMDPYMGIGDESREWCAGRMETLGDKQRRAA